MYINRKLKLPKTHSVLYLEIVNLNLNKFFKKWFFIKMLAIAASTV